jgi:PIN domain nuclease of toxin-antitoxin system
MSFACGKAKSMSRLLLDACTFVWLNSNIERIPRRVQELCADRDNRIYLSSVTAWEITAKHHAGRLLLPEPPQEFITNSRAASGTISLRLREEDIFQLAKLPPIHRDPFDRMLICQAISRGLTIITPDSHVRQYPVPTIW